MALLMASRRISTLSDAARPLASSLRQATAALGSAVVNRASAFARTGAPLGPPPGTAAHPNGAPFSLWDGLRNVFRRPLAADSVVPAAAATNAAARHPLAPLRVAQPLLLRSLMASIDRVADGRVGRWVRAHHRCPIGAGPNHAGHAGHSMPTRLLRAEDFAAGRGLNHGLNHGLGHGLNHGLNHGLGHGLGQGLESVNHGLASPPPSSPPVLCFPGCGLFFFWQLGAARSLQRRLDLTRVDMAGASAGALAAALLGSGLTAEASLAFSTELASRLATAGAAAGSPLGLLGRWGPVLRSALESHLPTGAAAACRGRVHVMVLRLRDLRLRAISDFRDRSDLIDAVLASLHIPFFIDGRPWATFRGEACIDGGLGGPVSVSGDAISPGRPTLCFHHGLDEALAGKGGGRQRPSDFLFLDGRQPDLARLAEFGDDYAERVFSAGAA